MLSLVALTAAFTICNRGLAGWTLFSKPVEDADVSCYILPNGTHVCASDSWLTRGLDREDSY